MASGLRSLGVGPATDHYLPLTTQQAGNPIAAPAFTLLDTATGAMRPISPPPCYDFGGAALSERYFAAQCQEVTPSSARPLGPEYVYLLNLWTNKWMVRQISSTLCTTGCGLDGVGRSWMRISVPPIDTHDPPSLYLQNIVTGVVKPDNGRDSLNNPSGISHPCAATPAGSFDEDFPSNPSGDGFFSQLGSFLLTTGTYDIFTGTSSPAVLRACRGTARVSFGKNSVAATNQMVVWQPAEAVTSNTPSTDRRIFGLSIPGVRPFVISTVKGRFVAVSNRTVYETVTDASGSTTSLWDATVPKSVLVRKTQRAR